MLTWGFLLLVGGFIACLILFLSQIPGIFENMQNLGAGYFSAFFANFSTEKLAFLVAAFLTVLGLVLYIVGLSRNKDEKKSIIPANVKKYLRDSKGEYKKIVWPGFPTVLRNTGVVLAMCAVVAVLIIAVDSLSTWLIQLLLSIKL